MRKLSPGALMGMLAGVAILALVASFPVSPGREEVGVAFDGKEAAEHERVIAPSARGSGPAVEKAPSFPDEVASAETLEQMRTPTRLYASAKVSAVYDRDQLLGVRIDRVQEGSLWERLGVESGDVVLEVNGELVDDPQASVLLMNALSEEETLLLRVRGVGSDERMLAFRVPRS